jgi:hypothetical protein
VIFGRPSNAWIGLVTAAGGFLQVVLVTTRPDIDAVAVATIIGASVGFLGVLIAFIANQPPTVNTGDKVEVITPQGEPNKTIVV